MLFGSGCPIRGWERQRVHLTGQEDPRKLQAHNNLSLPEPSVPHAIDEILVCSS